MRYIKKHRHKSASPTGRPCLLYDKQEKNPWMFLEQHGYVMKKVHLKVGDYTFEDFEDQIAIEKKSGLAELLTDLTSRYRETFKRFLAKLAEVPIRVIIVEDDLSHVAAVIKVLQQQSSGRFLLTEETVYYWVSKITIDYGIPILFIGRHQKQKEAMLYYLFDAVVKKLT